MDRTRSQRVLIWSIVVLAVLNLVSLSALWFVRFEHKRPQPRRKADERLEDVIVRQVGLDSEQEARFRELHARHRLVKDSLENEVFRLKAQIQKELFSPSPDTAKMSMMAAQIGELQAEFERQVYQHTFFLKALCRPEQYPRLKAILDDLLDAAQRGPAPGPDNPRGPGRPREGERRPNDEHRPPPR